MRTTHTKGFAHEEDELLNQEQAKKQEHITHI
jgi:hypothetical protein